MIQIPERYEETVRRFIREYANRRTWEIEQAFLGIQVGMITDELAFGSALADQLAEIARAADGQMEHTENGWTEGVLYEGVQDLMERLFCPPGLGTAYDIPARFWETDLGQMVARAMLWMRGDELITIREAAELRGVSVQAISQAIAAGKLRRYVDPDAPARQGRVLVSRREVMEDGSGVADSEAVADDTAAVAEEVDA